MPRPLHATSPDRDTVTEARPLRVAVATNEPWGTYHLRPLLGALSDRPGIEVRHVVPYAGHLPAGPHAPVHFGERVDADVLVVTGFTDWPAAVAHANPDLPIVASCLAYMNPTPAPAGDLLRARLLTITAPSPADATAFAGHLGINPDRVLVVGSPTLDATPVPAHTGHTLIVTSVTHPSDTGGAAPGTDLLATTARALADHGHDVVVRLHPREDPAVWDGFTHDTSLSARDAATGARLVVGIPGTAFAEIAALGVPIVGITAPHLNVPDHLVALCGTLLRDGQDLARWVPTARTQPATPETVADAVGPIGGAAGRLLDAWETALLR